MFYAVAAICAYFVKGLCGFANTLIFGSILSFGVNNVNISPIDLLLGYPSNVILAWKNRKELQWRVWVPTAALVLIGNIPGILLLKNADARMIKILFGIAIIGIAIEMTSREFSRKKTDSEKKTKGSKIVLMVIGLVSGVLCGLYGVGALLAAYMSRATKSSRAFKANICAVFITENTFRIMVYSITGILTYDVIQRAALLVPAMLIGLIIGVKSAGFLNEAAVKKIVIIMLLLSGISLIITNLV